MMQLKDLTELFKTMLRKHAAKFGLQWDQYLSRVLWAYRNTPHSSTGEKPLFLLFGFDCRYPTEAALLPTKPPTVTNISDYREQVVLSLSSARRLAEQTCKEAQRKYKYQYDKAVTTSKFKIGDWVLVYFPQEETGKNRKLSQPWRGPYRIVSRNDPDVTVTKIYFPEDQQIQVHQSRIQHCQPSIPAGFYWYGSKKSKPNRPLKHVLNHLAALEADLSNPMNAKITETAPQNNQRSQAEDEEDYITTSQKSRTIENDQGTV